MFAKTTILILATAVTGPIALADGLPGTDVLSSEEAALVAWSEGFKARAEALTERISAPAREQIEGSIRQGMENTAAEQQRQMEAGMRTLGEIVRHSPQAWAYGDDWCSALRVRTVLVGTCARTEIVGLPGDEILSCRLATLVAAWDRCQKRYSARRITIEALRRERAIQNLVAKRRTEILREDTSLVKEERARRERVVRRLAKKYAANWLLGGYPDAYLPAEWTALAAQSGGAVRISTGTKTVRKPADRELQLLRESIGRLTDVLVEVGMSECGPERVVQVERQLRTTRRQTQSLMLARTGMNLEKQEVQLAVEATP